MDYYLIHTPYNYVYTVTVQVNVNVKKGIERRENAHKRGITF